MVDSGLEEKELAAALLGSSAPAAGLEEETEAVDPAESIPWPSAEQMDKLARKVTSLAFSSDGKSVATGDADGVVRFWEIEQPAAGLEGLTLPQALADLSDLFA